MTAVLGPPWRAVSDPRAILSVSPPVLVACDALAAADPHHGVLVRADNRFEVERLARSLAEKGSGEAVVLHGAIKLGSGQWLWPLPQEVVTLAKAADPSSRRGFATIVDDLFSGLSSAASSAEGESLRDAIAALEDLQFGEMTPEQLEAALSRMGAAITRTPGRRAFQRLGLTRAQRTALSVAARALQRAAPTAIRPRLTGDQRATARFIGRNSLAFVSNEYGIRSDRASAEARRIIGRGVAQGLGQQEIARDLQAAVGQAVSGRNEFYFRVVASSAVSRARSFGQMTGYQQAGIETYVWTSVGDNRVCEICRYLDGQEFPVQDSIARFNRAAQAATPEEALSEFQWYRLVGAKPVGDEGLRGGGEIFVGRHGGGVLERVASVVSSTMGQADRNGTFQTHSNPRTAGGTIVPPAHGLCRCTTIPG